MGALARQDGGMVWPAFRWSGGVGGRPAYLAHMKKNAIRCAGWLGFGGLVWLHLFGAGGRFRVQRAVTDWRQRVAPAQPLRTLCHGCPQCGRHYLVAAHPTLLTFPRTS